MYMYMLQTTNKVNVQCTRVQVTWENLRFGYCNKYINYVAIVTLHVVNENFVHVHVYNFYKYMYMNTTCICTVHVVRSTVLHVQYTTHVHVHVVVIYANFNCLALL